MRGGGFVECQRNGRGWENAQFAEPPPEVLSYLSGEAASARRYELIEAAQAGAGRGSPNGVTREFQATRELPNFVSSDGIGDKRVRYLLTPDSDL
jgi:hypothetical protein